MSTFKAGDRVRCIHGYLDLATGQTYTVVDVRDPSDGPSAILQLRDVAGGHFARRFELVQKKPTTPTATGPTQAQLDAFLNYARAILNAPGDEPSDNAARSAIDAAVSLLGYRIESRLEIVRA